MVLIPSSFCLGWQQWFAAHHILREAGILLVRRVRRACKTKMFAELCDADAAHLLECEDEACGRCLWLRNRSEWERRTCILESSVSYLKTGLNDAGEWELYCWECRQADPQVKPFGVVHVNNLVRHSSCKKHQASLFEMGLISQGMDIQAPPAKQFRLVGDSRKPGNAWRNGVEGVGGRRKLTCMLQCVATTMVRSEQEFLAGAVSIALHGDVRKLRCMFRYKESTPTELGGFKCLVASALSLAESLGLE
ncbi:unnamed protein product, partial [Symbiodinium microadriaticum]